MLVSLMLPSIRILYIFTCILTLHILAVHPLPADDRYRIELPLIPHSEGSDYYPAVYIDVRLGVHHGATIVQYMIACCMHACCCMLYGVAMRIKDVGL